MKVTFPVDVRGGNVNMAKHRIETASRSHTPAARIVGYPRFLDGLCPKSALVIRQFSRRVLIVCSNLESSGLARFGKRIGQP